MESLILHGSEQSKQAIEAGWGYWDVTHYPYGGSFKRAIADMPIVENLGPAGKYPSRESKVKLANGAIAIVQNQAITGVK